MFEAFMLVGSAAAFAGCLYLSMVAKKHFVVATARTREMDELYKPVSEIEEALKTAQSSYETLRSDYEKSRKALLANEKAHSLYIVGSGVADIAPCPPIPASVTLQDLEQKMKEVVDARKQLVRDKKACLNTNHGKMVVNGRKGAANTMFAREVRLRIRVFDDELKALLAMVSWNNVKRFELRLEASFKAINSVGPEMGVSLLPTYLQLGKRELRLKFDIDRLKQQIKEEQREERAFRREQERAEQQLARAAENARLDREKMERLVARELARIESATEEQRELLQLHQQELDVLVAEERRAVSMAQITRAGFVYVISNEASFGPGVCKIGMTRRLDPMDRVKELGDASVPALFDVHAFAYCEDAPVLEKFLHERFSQRRVNRVNWRKEFFYIEPQEALAALRTYPEPFALEVY
jgi:hypothetical protein